MTNDCHRRIKQHNREMQGGAWATETRGPYHHVACISGFFDKSQCHECEWALKHIPNRVRTKQKFGGPLG